MKTIHLLIKGKVQGVFYRATAKDVAKLSGLKGWIANTEDGSVEAVVSGEEEKLQEFIQWSKQGPSRADVTEVIVTEKEYEEFEKFSVIRGS